MLECLRMDGEIGPPEYVVAGVWKRAADAQRFNFIGAHGYAHLHPDEYVFCYPEYDVAQLGHLILIREAQNSFQSVLRHGMPGHELHAFCMNDDWLKELRTGFNGPLDQERPLRLGRLTRYMNRTFLAWNWELQEDLVRGAGHSQRWIRVFPSYWSIYRFRREVFEKWQESHGPKAPSGSAGLESCLEADGVGAEQVGGYYRAVFPTPESPYDCGQVAVRQFFQDRRLVVDTQAYVSLSCGMLGLHCLRDGRLEPVREAVVMPGDICISWGMYIDESQHSPPSLVITDEPGEEFDDGEERIIRLRRLADRSSDEPCGGASEGPKRDLCLTDLKWLKGWMDRCERNWKETAERCGEGCPGCRRQEQ